MIRHLNVIEMLVVALAGLVIETQHAGFIHHVRQPVLVQVGAALKRFGQFPIVISTKARLLSMTRSFMSGSAFMLLTIATVFRCCQHKQQQ